MVCGAELTSLVPTGQSTSITSLLGHPITKFDIYQQRFMVAKTPKSLVISDFIGNLTGEILWAGSGKERFYFANPQVRAFPQPCKIPHTRVLLCA